MRKFSREAGAISIVLQDRRYSLAFAAISAISFIIYSYLLQGTALNLAMPKIIFGLNAYALAASTSISILLALSIVMSAFSALNGASSGAKLSLGSIVVSIAPVSLCCTPVVPALLAVLGASTPTIIGVTGTLQGPFATYEVLFIAMSIILLLLSVVLASKGITKCCRRTK